MSDWGIGYVSGIVIGFVAGFIAGRKREPWSELTDKQRKVIIGLIAAGVVLLAAGIVVFFFLSS
jgi:hypothetical protein